MTARIGVLGPVRIADRDAGGTPMRALLAALVLAGTGTTRSVPALAAEVWGDDQPQNPKAALQTLVSRARALAGSDAIASAPGGYALGTDDTDLHTARRLRAEAETLGDGDPDRIRLLGEAIGLWRGEPGVDLGDAPIAEDLAAESAELRDALQRDLAASLVSAGRSHEAVAILSELAAARPFEETAQAELMSALAADDRAAEALAVFARLRAALAEHLGASPGPAVTELNAQLLRDQDSGPRVRIGVQAAPNELIGREDAMRQAGALLAIARAVTIVGPGGLGKTRLAHALAAGSRVDVVAVVPLAGVRDDAGVPIAIAAALGISEAAPGARLSETHVRPDLRARIVAVLNERPALLVLDNCEQVIDGVAAWTADLLQAVPALRVLTTSRTPLAIGAERILVLDPLGIAADPDAPAVRLFAERAEAVRPGVMLDADAVARLCAHLDGLPLAIELAAARVRTMSLAEIEDRLADRFALLTSGDRAAPERHRTLEAVIGWSWDLLDAEAQRALATLSFLPGGFSAHTATAILGAPADDVLDRLAAQSLLVVTESGARVRFRMLETVREFGLARLADAGEEDAAWTAVTRWAAAFVGERLTSGAIFPSGVTAEAHGDIGQEHDNLVFVLHRLFGEDREQEALRLFALIGPSWFMRGAFSEVFAFRVVVIEAAQRLWSAGRNDEELDCDIVVIALVMATLGSLAMDDRRALRALALLRLWERRAGGAISAAWRALVVVMTASRDQQHVEEQLKAMRSSDDRRSRLMAEMLLAHFSENQGDPDEALIAAQAAWSLANDSGERWAAATAADAAAQLASQSARPAEALMWLDRAAAIFAEFDAVDALRQQKWVRGAALLALGRIEESDALFRSLVASRELSQDGLELASIGWYGLGAVHLQAGEQTEAFDAFARGLAHFSSPSQRRSPWFLMAIAGYVSARSRVPGADPADLARWVRRMRGRMIAGWRMRPELTDSPVLGTVLVGWAAWALQDPALRDRAVEALGVAEALGARQDLPTLRLDGHFAEATRICGRAAVEAARHAARELSLSGRVDRAFALLRGR